MTCGLLISSRKKTKLYKNFLAGKIDFKIYKSYRNKFTLLVTSAKALYYKNYINSHRKNSKAMWKIINAQLNKSRINNHFNKMNPNNLNNFFANLGFHARKDIKSINSFTKHMASPFGILCFHQELLKLSLLMLLTNCLLSPSLVMI